MVKHLHLMFFDLESFVFILGFNFLPWSIFKNPEIMENFQKLIFGGIKSNDLISNTFQGILCVQDKTLKVLLRAPINTGCFWI